MVSATSLFTTYFSRFSACRWSSLFNCRVVFQPGMYLVQFPLFQDLVDLVVVPHGYSYGVSVWFCSPITPGSCLPSRSPGDPSPGFLAVSLFSRSSCSSLVLQHSQASLEFSLSDVQHSWHLRGYCPVHSSHPFPISKTSGRPASSEDSSSLAFGADTISFCQWWRGARRQSGVPEWYSSSLFYG